LQTQFQHNISLPHSWRWIYRTTIVQHISAGHSRLISKSSRVLVPPTVQSSAANTHTCASVNTQLNQYRSRCKNFLQLGM